MPSIKSKPQQERAQISRLLRRGQPIKRIIGLGYSEAIILDVERKIAERRALVLGL